MSLFDLICFMIIGGFALFGLWFGLVHTLGSLLGTVLGVFLAFRWYAPFATWLMQLTGWTGNFPKVIVFVIAFLIVNRLVGLLFFFLDKVLSIITTLPFINGLNRLLGGIFGVLEGIIVLGIVFYFINKFPVNQAFMDALAVSKVAPVCLHAASILWPLIPVGIRALQDTLRNINV